MKKNSDKILNSGERFAVISTNEIKYYSNRKDLYKDFPALHPNAEISYGTHPLLIDIGEITSSLEYRLEVVKERKKEIDKSLTRLNKRKERLSIIEQKLLEEEKGKK
jgi:hypothetical protein